MYNVTELYIIIYKAEILPDSRKYDRQNKHGGMYAEFGSQHMTRHNMQLLISKSG